MGEMREKTISVLGMLKVVATGCVDIPGGAYQVLYFGMFLDFCLVSLMLLTGRDSMHPRFDSYSITVLRGISS